MNIKGINYTNNEDSISMDCLTNMERYILYQLLLKEQNTTEDEIIKEGCQIIINKIYINSDISSW